MSSFLQSHADDIVPQPIAAGADEAELIRETLRGDQRAFEQIVRTHSRRLYNFLFQLTRQCEDAEDLVQQTFLKAYRHLDRFDTARPLVNWLFTIARRTALNHFRSAKKWEEIPEDAASPGPSPARAAEIQDGTESLWAKAREILSQREFEVLWLRFAEELSTEETARVTGLTQTHIKVLVYRARQRLMKGETSR